MVPGKISIYISNDLGKINLHTIIINHTFLYIIDDGGNIMLNITKPTDE